MARVEAERGRRALKSQGTSRPFNKNRRTQLNKIINQRQSDGMGPSDGNENNQEMTIHDIMSIERVEQAG